MTVMKKRVMSFALSMFMLLPMMSAAHAESEYIPLRRTFEEKGYTVTWTAERPDDILVGIVDYVIGFRNQTNTGRRGRNITAAPN